jgi:hypothetical protein
MANTSARLQIRRSSGYRNRLPKKLIDLPEGQTYYIVWNEGTRKRARRGLCGHREWYCRQDDPPPPPDQSPDTGVY